MTARQRQTTPAFTGFLVSTGRFTDHDSEAFEIAKSIAKRVLGEGWVVKALGRGARDYRMSPSGKTQISTGQAWDLASKLENDRDVSDVELEFTGPGLEPSAGVEKIDIARAGGGGSDTPLPGTNPPAYDWSLTLCRIRNAWEIQPPGGKSFGEGIVVGHPDTGYTQHEEIWSADNTVNRLLWREGKNFFNNTASPTDLLDGENPGHGTATSSVIMANADATSGDRVDGVAPRAKLIPLRVTNDVKLFNFGNLAEAIHYAVEKGVHVISISLGGPLPSRTLHRAVQRAVDNGVVVLAAAGNVWPFVVYPARFDEVIAVAACNCDRKVWNKSASGGDVDVSAPGESVWVARTKREGDVLKYSRDRGSGTSFAVATTAGACALWLAFHGWDALVRKYGAPNIATVFKELVMASAEAPAGWKKNKYGAGILNVEQLLKVPLPDTPHGAGLSIRASAAPKSTSYMDEVNTLLPDLTRNQVRTGLKKFLNADETTLRDILHEHGDEIVFHVSTNAAVRDQIRRLSRPASMRRAAATRATRSDLSETASTALKRHIAGKV